MNWKSALAFGCGALFLLVFGNSRMAYAAPTDPCSLLSQARVSAVLGVTVGTGKASGKAECEWSQPSSGLRGKAILLEILGPMGRLTPVDRFNTVKMPVGRIVKTPVSGLGDDAVYVETAGATLYVKKGGSVFQVRVFGSPLEQIKAKEKSLAQDVLAKL